tara:strand:+ start:600 stop:1040 length:441 start_codon:yes stop_codon:yes gene_type:complete
MNNNLFIASDHAGYELKKKIIDINLEKEFNFIDQVVDLGTNNLDSVDYPDYANNLVKKMNSVTDSKGILICGSGIGMSIAANRYNNIRAGLAFNSEIARLIRAHNNANIMVLPGRYMNLNEALECIKNFFLTNFDGGRHINRVKKL